jgi:hypothetical protein
MYCEHINGFFEQRQVESDPSDIQHDTCVKINNSYSSARRFSQDGNDVISLDLLRDLQVKVKS